MLIHLILQVSTNYWTVLKTEYQIKNETTINNYEHYGTKLVPVMAYSAHNA